MVRIAETWRLGLVVVGVAGVLVALAALRLTWGADEGALAWATLGAAVLSLLMGLSILFTGQETSD